MRLFKEVTPTTTTTLERLNLAPVPLPPFSRPARPHHCLPASETVGIQSMACPVLDALRHPQVPTPKLGPIQSTPPL